MAKKRGNPLSGEFRDPPQEGNAAVPAQAGQDEDKDQFKMTDAPAPERAGQGDAPAEPSEALAGPVPADAPAPEQADQGDAPDQPAATPADPAPADVPAPEQAEQGDTPGQPAEAPADPALTDAPTQDWGNFNIPENSILSAAQRGEPGLITAVLEVSDIHPFEGFDTPDGHFDGYSYDDDADIGVLVESIKQHGVLEPVTVAPRPAGGYEVIYGHRRLKACQLAGIQTIPTIVVQNFNRDEFITVNPPSVHKNDPEQADQGDVPADPSEAPADPAPADAPAPEQADQGDTPDQPAEAPAGPAAADAPAPEQADQGDAPAEPAEAPAGPATPEHPEARFVKLADIKPLSGTFVKDTPREDYSELLDSIKANGLEKPIILRQDEAGGFQLVDGFHRCEAMKQAGMLEILADVYDMNPLAANRYRKEHRDDPGLPIPGKLLPAHPPKEEPAADKDAPAQDEEEFEVPKNFSLPIAKEGQSELVTTLKVADIHPFEGHPFNVVDNKDMWELRDSVQRHGVMEPVMVINRPAGGYEMVSGHRRLRACQLAGIQTIPAIVRNLDRDEATIAMVDANLKREEISPMEKARAYQMKTEAMKRKVGRRSKVEAATGEKPLSADEELAKQVGESVATVQRYKTLNKLVPEMQELVDKKQVPVNTGADIAQLKPEEQKELADAIQKEAKVPTGAQVKEMKKQSAEGTLTTEAIKQSVAPTKREENPPLKVTLVEEDLRPYFPDKRTTTPDVKKAIFEALALRQKLQERQQAAAAKGEAKPPDQPAADGGQKPPASGPEKKAEPAAGGAKKPSGPTAGGRGKKPPAPKPKKSGPAR